MKYLFNLLLVLVVSFSACKKENSERDFDKSYTAWLKFKTASNNSYSYKVSTHSWTGTGSTTTLKVSNGIVIGREYTRYSTDEQTGQRIIRDSWTEDSSALNSHISGAESLTLDEIYERARTIWLKADSKQGTIVFEANNDGLISNCGYIPNNCMDDCFSGISIISIQSVDH